MTFKWLIFPVFLIGLILTNIKAGLIFLFHPIIKYRFFSFSLIALILYLTFFASSIFRPSAPVTVKLTNYSQTLDTLSLINFNKFQKLEGNLKQLEKNTGGTTLVYLNLALVAHYQGKLAQYNQYWQQAASLDPNHQIFK